jgi:hypothetical protein
MLKRHIFYFVYDFFIQIIFRVFIFVLIANLDFIFHIQDITDYRSNFLVYLFKFLEISKE